MRKPKHFLNEAEMKRRSMRMKEEIDVDLFN